MQDNTVTVSDVINDDSKNLKTILDSNPITNNDDNYEINLEMGNCRYFTETEFKDFINEKNISDQSHLKILSLNVANLISKLKSIKILIQNISNTSNRPNIITITETHLSKSQNHG